MGFRFRRTISVIPGVRVNISKSGLSTSLGVRGAHVTLGHGKIRQTVGIPGTGLSYTTVSRARSGRGDSGTLEVIKATIWVVRYLPLIVLYGAFIYAAYQPIKGWHPVFIGLLLLSVTWTFFTQVGRLAALVSRDAATWIGAVFYAAGMVAWKVAGLPELDWIWTAVLTVLCAMIGAWSYRSCHAAMVRMPGSGQIGPSVHPNMSTSIDTAYTHSETLEDRIEDLADSRGVIPPAKIVSNFEELAQCQATVCASLCAKGWDARVITAKDAQGLVTAEYREKQLVILCDPSTTPVGDEAVYRIYAYCCDHGADFAAIVSNATYTASESRLALGTRVLLIQPDQLHLLQEMIFGTTALEPQQLFRVEVE